MRHSTHILCCLGCILTMVSCTSYGAAPPMRDEVNLAGNWTGGEVPHLTSGQGAKTWERQFDVPASWAGKKIFIELETVNFSPITIINGTEVGRITGSWLPHSHDITSYVKPGSRNNTVRIVASGKCPANWPAGFNYGGNNNRWAGLIHDVYLRAYGMVAIRDAEVITSVANKTITVKYDLENFNTTTKTVTVNANIFPSAGGPAALTLATSSTSLAAGERKIVEVSSPWNKPDLWWLTDPKLYNLCSTVKEGGTTVDSQTVRFGFRECKISGRYLSLNGVRLNCHGESVEMETQGYPNSAAGMRAWINMEKSVNGNSIRFHVKPPTNEILAECDEMGQMVMPEAALWQSSVTGTSETQNIWMPAFVKHFRNHASVIQWSSNNECYGSGSNIARLVNVIKANDGSGRPIWSEDVDYPGSETMCKHYPEGYEHLPNTGNMYSTSWISTTKPQSCGEFCACCWVSNLVPDVYYWQGLSSRAMRYNNVSVIHPYNYSSFIFNNYSQVVTTYMKNSFAPVALFDYGYDGQGIEPIKSNAYPSVAAGSNANRILVLYNDEFVDERVTVQVDVKSVNTTYATTTKVYNVMLGNHIEFPCSFQVPYVGGSIMDLVLTTRKGDVKKFSETKRFTVTGSSSGTSSSTIMLGDGEIDPITSRM